MEPISSCHKCDGDSAGNIQVQAPALLPDHNPQRQPPTLVELDFDAGLSFGNFEQGYETQHYPFTSDLEVQYSGGQTEMQFFPSETDTFGPGSSLQNPFVGIAMVVPEPPLLQNSGIIVQEPIFFDYDLNLLQKKGLDSLIGPRPKVQCEEYSPKAPGCPSFISLSDIASNTKQPPATRKTPKSVSQCNYPYVKLHHVQCEAQAEAKMSHLERVKMKFKMSSDGPQGGRSLKMHVEVIIKLLRIRSKVAEMRSKKKKRRLPLQPTATSDDGYDAGSDTDSANDDSLASSPGVGIAPLIQWEEVEERSFSFDVSEFIDNLSQWGSGMDSNMRLDMLYSDPQRILDFISIYIMFNFISKLTMI
ncbi:uncharacterized protein N7511_004452 [Penicillium nucicola]|uniref:uncharacterized protein n=1 Tax=Penicillium nucicola TaxID=1850975 RepID=UPI0025457899|nr:uncharacterized protein N7511_004452 [Penicillium nucicola]KAJ5766836.1 hypothetical protein N7511_004452 [Penicillium nucicola]